MGYKEDLTGHRFGKLVVLSFSKSENRKSYWHCRCDCGNEVDVRSDILKRGGTKSCGCLNTNAKHIDLTGRRFGRLLVNSYAGLIKKKAYWNCTCDCGNKTIARADQLKGGEIQSCGCFNVDYHKQKYKDLTGKHFGYWTVISKADTNNNGAFWHCKCNCGTEKIIKATALLSGQTLSCGCFNREVSHLNAKHGMSKTRVYNIWQGMKDRCYNPHNKKYRIYGGKGIKVCDEWQGEHGFEHFYEWAISNGYKDNLTIDRYPNKDGNYCPKNCRWATYREQANNLSSNHLVTYQGESHTLAEWSRITGISYCTIKYRISKGWNEERLFDPPPRRKRS